MKPNKIFFQSPKTTILLVESGKYGKHLIVIDTEDYDKIKNYRWSVLPRGNTFYARSTIYQNRKKINLKLHRLILNYKNPLVIDHKNHNGLDNRKSNLRICTQSQNSQNQVVKASGFKGISWHIRKKKWIARIFVNKKLLHLGYHTQPELAAAVYNQAAIKYYGEFALLNKI